jgi:hypothetical protein
VLGNQFGGEFEIEVGQREFAWPTGWQQIVHALEGRTDPFQEMRTALCHAPLMASVALTWR